MHHLPPPTVPYTPYVVSVAAINGAGAGEPVSVVEFTAEGSKIKQQQFKSYNFIHVQFLCSILEILVPLDWMEQLCGCHGDHSVAQRLEASLLTTPSPTGELALMLRMLVPLLYLGKTPALL